MNESNLPRVLLDRFGIRIGPAMRDYVAARLKLAPGGQGIVVMGNDARTGVPRRQIIDPHLLSDEAQSRAL